MNAEELIKMANKAKVEKDFYRAKYVGLKDFAVVEEIPVICKKELLDFEVAEAKAFWEPNIKATAALAADVFKEGTTGSTDGKRLTFPQLGIAEIVSTFDILFSQPIWKEYFGSTMPEFICNAEFDWNRVVDVSDKYALKQIAARDFQNEDTIKEQIAAAQGTVAWMGNKNWLEWAAKTGLMQPEHWVILMPKPSLGFQLDEPHWQKTQQMRVFVTTETGIIGYYTNKYCDRQDYHLYRDGIDLYSEIVGKQLVSSMQREILPFIRYGSGDTGEIYEGKCSCGFTGKFFKYIGRL